jgi:hypothetical protein
MTGMVMLPVAHVDDAVVGLQPVSVDRPLKLDPAADNRLEAGPFAVRPDLGVDPAVPLVDAEDDGPSRR